MTDFFSVNDAIRGNKLFYLFRDPPSADRKASGRFAGKLHGNGHVEVVEPLVLTPGGAPNAADCIRCKTARYECDKEPDKARKQQDPRGRHRGWGGFLKGNAMAEILIPGRSHA